jgi:hypothetical protein
MSKTPRAGRYSFDGTQQPEANKASVGKITVVRPDLATQLRGLYGKVAQQLDLDPLYVSRVARGEAQSQRVEEALARELENIMESLKEQQDIPPGKTGLKSESKEIEGGGKIARRTRHSSSQE